jgi:hypothetical protein
VYLTATSRCNVCNIFIGRTRSIRSGIQRALQHLEEYLSLAIIHHVFGPQVRGLISPPALRRLQRKEVSSYDIGTILQL